MTGEALLAPWLKELEILSSEVPCGKESVEDSESLGVGEVVKDFSITFKGEPVNTVMMELTALGKDYMVAASARSATGRDIPNLKMGHWKVLDMDSDILAFGEEVL